jgi:hypothetical protein
LVLMNTANALDRMMMSPELATAVEASAAAIARLDARVSVSFIALPWRRRASWTGYARALQLQGTEIDEIDVFSWGCGLNLRDRPRRVSATDEFGDFAAWSARLDQPASVNWRDSFPFTPTATDGVRLWPSLLRAIEILRQTVRSDPATDAWLWLPSLLKAHGLSETPLPCLVEGTKALRLRATPTPEEWRAVIRAIGKAASQGLDRLSVMEGFHQQAISLVTSERRPGSLSRLVALSALHPLLSPQAVAELLGLSLPGSGKLLSRAAEMGLLVEVSGRMAWRRYLVPDLAISFGYLASSRGRPAKTPPPEAPDRSLACTLASFDTEMRELSAMLSALGIPSAGD